VETVDGPASATPGRGRTSWYTSSAAELFRASTEAILGIRADWEGLRVRPCLPPDWKQAQAVRVFRGATYQIQILRDLKLSPGTQVILFNDQKLAGDVLPLAPGRTCQVVVAVGPAAAGTNGYAAHPPAAKAALPRLALAAAGKA
jgi:cellobiose phosphorylase